MARPRKNGSSGSLEDSVTADHQHTGVKRKTVTPATGRETRSSQPALPSMEGGA